jgi:hypothetical protein
MITRRLLGLAIAAVLVAAALLLALSSPQHPKRRSSSRSRVTLFEPIRIPPLAPSPAAVARTTTPSPPPHRSSGPQRVARRFLERWLRCTYHQAPCSRIAGTLPAYAAVLGRQAGRSLATPAELAARPRIVSLKLLRSCDRAAVAAADYNDREGGRYQLHVNLVREPAGWQVFDVAEAPPHIPLPKPITEGPQAC